MLYFNLNAVLKARQIEQPYTYLVKAGISPHSATKLLNSQTRVFRLDHIEKLCQILHCEPNDLVQFKPSTNQNLPENHPLNKLLQTETDLTWQNSLKTMPLSQLKELTKKINESKNNEE